MNKTNLENDAAKAGGKSRTDTRDEANADIGAAIGERLKRLYKEAADQAVPDRFTDLLDQLQRKERSNGSS
ncbi:MAG: hypothetical protein KDJ29_15230 [Hyphomicrobiales bacterium]|nr:hypothetical protein [Hyphomicrobiales bacterium]